MTNEAPMPQAPSKTDESRNPLIVDVLLKPDPRTRACPFLPPIPLQNQVTGRVDKLMLTPCVGPVCAVHDRCQGKFSLKSTLLLVAETLDEIGSAVPFVAGPLAGVAARMKARLNAD